jgi:hypothetical protein
MNEAIKAKKTAHNRSVYAPPPSAAPRFRSPRSLRSHGSLHPHLASPGLCFAKPLFGLAKRHIQPERYVQCALKLVENINNLKIIGKTLTLLVNEYSV